jgi:hypothetical protein
MPGSLEVDYGVEIIDMNGPHNYAYEAIAILAKRGWPRIRSG